MKNTLTDLNKCIQAPWWGLSEKVIKRLTPYQPDVPDTNVGNKISKFIDGIEDIFADIRERHGDDSVCGLCEYDGAYMGQSGDWCNECPGFDKDDCFKLSDETRKKWIEEIVNAYPDHTADIGKKVSISCGQENDLISRQAAIDALDKRFDDVPMELTTEILQLRRDLRERIPSAQPATSCSEIPNSSTDCISRQAAIDAIEEIYEWHDNVTKERIIEHFVRLPSVQPEIIRCKDCKWGAQDEDGWWYCVEIGGRMGDGEKGDGFCSDAERRTDGKNT